MQTTFLVNGITIACETHGDGPPLVLIAGVGYGGWFWHKVVPALSARFRVITFDNRGAGGSDKPKGPYTITEMADDVAGLLDALHSERACVLGHSLGGFIAQELAVQRPDLLDKLILAGTHHGGPSAIPIPEEALTILLQRDGNPLELFHRGMAVATAPGFRERKPEAIRELLRYRATGPVPPAAYEAQVSAGASMGLLTEGDVTARLAQIRVPTLVLFGEHDRVVPTGNATLLARKIPDARVTILPDTGHLFPLEDPDATAAAIMAFAGAPVAAG